MPCPFPGMDPYIERPAIWPDFHDALVSAIRGLLQPLLGPRYVALMQNRWFVVESDREEVKQPLLQVIEPAAGNRVVTAIEVLSPDNKTPGPGRDNYLRKREEYWGGGANLVEIDLLRGGRPTVRLNDEQVSSLQPYRHLVGVTRSSPARHEVYAIPLDQRLPKVAIPLAYDDQDVSLDLQAAMTRCWDEGPYPALLHYDEPPPADLTPAEQAWCRERLQAANV